MLQRRIDKAYAILRHMKRGLYTQAYTLAEVMIFLAISSLILVSYILLFNSADGRQEFTDSTREVISYLDEVMNNVTTGDYGNTANFQCRRAGAPPAPTINSFPSDTQGTNLDCIFIGKAIQFGLHGTDGEGYYTYSLIGLRNSSTSPSRAATTNAETMPTVFNAANAVDQRKVRNGVFVNKITYLEVGSDVRRNTGGIAFISDLGRYKGSGLVSNSLGMGMYAIGDSDLNMTSAQMIAKINDHTLRPGNPTNVINIIPAGQIKICLQSREKEQYLTITIGILGGSGNNRTLTLAWNTANSVSVNPEHCNAP